MKLKYNVEYKYIFFFEMSFKSGLSQRTELTGKFFNNSTCQTYDNTETNTALIASLQYVKSFTDYFIYLTYLLSSNPIFEGTMTGQNSDITVNLSVPTINGACNFTGSPTIQEQAIEYSILGEIKMVINEIPANYLVCNGSSYATDDYPDLFNIIGYTYGGSGNNFNLPNFESYFPIGANFDNGAGNPVSNFAYGNNTAGAINTYVTTFDIENSLITQMPSHAHDIPSQNHSHFMGFENVTNHYYNTEIGLIVPFLESTPSFSSQLDSATTGISVVNTGLNIQDIDPISGLNGINISAPYIAVKYCICSISMQ